LSVRLAEGSQRLRQRCRKNFLHQIRVRTVAAKPIENRKMTLADDQRDQFARQFFGPRRVALVPLFIRADFGKLLSVALAFVVEIGRLYAWPVFDLLSGDDVRHLLNGSNRGLRGDLRDLFRS